jgi:hypothetical protein
MFHLRILESFQKGFRHYFKPSKIKTTSIHYSKDHYWLQKHSTINNTQLFKVGITDNFFYFNTSNNLLQKDIGYADETDQNFDIEKIDILASPSERTDMCKGHFLKTNSKTNLLKIKWSCYKISESDELYHAVWSNINGTIDIKRPSEISEESEFSIHSFNFGL